MMSGALLSGQHQSQAMSLALGAARRSAVSIVVLTAAMIWAGLRLLQCGQVELWLCDAQLVRFSLAVMVNRPARSGTSVKTCAVASASHFLTIGFEVQRAVWPPSTTPAMSRR